MYPCEVFDKTGSKKGEHTPRGRRVTNQIDTVISHDLVLVGFWHNVFQT